MNDKNVNGHAFSGPLSLSRELSNWRILQPKIMDKVVQIVTDGDLEENLT